VKTNERIKAKMNASNLSQLRPQPRSGSSYETIGDSVSDRDILDCDKVNGNSERKRRGSGSFKGAEESDEEIVFRGGSQSSNMPGYDRLENSSGPGSPEEEKIKRKLKFFFLNPVEKYHATRKIPWKLCLQILKVLLVTCQLWIFAEYRYAHVNYYTNQQVTLEHVFIKDWDMVREVHAYPPSTGKLALYTKSEFFSFLDYTITRWAGIETDALGPFFRNSSIGFCVEHYKAANITKDLRFTMDTKLVEHCIHLEEDQLKSFNTSREWMIQNNLTIPWHAVEKLNLNFSLTSVTLRPLGPVPQPDCFQLKINIRFDNKDHDGQIPLHLDMEPVRLHCPTQTELTSSYSQFIVFLNLVVIILCFGSLLLCMRALLRAQLLKHEVGLFLNRNYNWTLTVSERLEFLNLWYVMICTNDCLIIMGSIIKGLIENRSIVGDMWDICSLMLGTGNMLVWFGILRYLGFFKTYNVLILTMKGAAPNMFRFLICAFFLYVGYAFAGWVILGPYHFKFETLMSTSECLFSLINGDDMFATFSSIPMEKTMSVWVYSRLYLYTFIGLFIYVVLSLFISIIMDTYEIIKNCYNNGFPPNRLEKFYSSCLFDFSSGQYSGEGVLVRMWRIARHRWNRQNYEQID